MKSKNKLRFNLIFIFIITLICVVFERRLLIEIVFVLLLISLMLVIQAVKFYNNKNTSIFRKYAMIIFNTSCFVIVLLVFLTKLIVKNYIR
jgi:hypothetical protein